jgi:hypothetical protein
MQAEPQTQLEDEAPPNTRTDRDTQKGGTHGGSTNQSPNSSQSSGCTADVSCHFESGSEIWN